MGGPRLLARLPHVVIAVLAVAFTGIGADQYSRLFSLNDLGDAFAMIQAGAVILALFRPVPAWWTVTVVMFVAAQAENVRLYEYDVVPYPWTMVGLAVQATVLLLLALRVPARTTVMATAISAAAGLFCLWNGRPSGWYQQDATVAIPVLVVAAVVGAALRSRRLARRELVEQEVLTAEERARRTLLEERNRIARELHDVVAHHMSVISIQAQVAPHLVADPTEELKENLAGIRSSAVAALTELRRVLGVLRTEDEASSLPDAARHSPQPTLDRLDELLDTVRGAGLAVTAESTGARRPLSPGVELSAFRIVQESLSNVMRHAPGARVRVEISHLPSGLGIRVVNSPPERAVPRASPGSGPGVRGLGLQGMGERAVMLGGELTAGPTPDGGYEVTAMLPSGASGLPVEPVGPPEPCGEPEPIGTPEPTGPDAPTEPNRPAEDIP
jgi:signal transduction histidine kinase